MLTPEYLAECTDYLLGMYDELDRAIIEDIARRIVKTGGITKTVEHQIDKVQQSGLLLQDVTKQVATVTRFSEEEIKALFNDAGIVGLSNDAKPLLSDQTVIPGMERYSETPTYNGQPIKLQLSPAMKQILDAMISKTNSDLSNMTMTTGATATNAYVEAVNMATMEVQSGAFTYEQAIRKAIKSSAVDGNFVSYPSGWRDRIDVAVRRAVLTSVNQTAAKLTETYARDMGCEYYEVSAHGGARPSHAVWQGRVYKIEGANAQYPNFVDSTGYGTGAGLCGWNCRHSFYPFWPGLSSPAYTSEILKEYDAPKFQYNGEKLTEYEVSQLMRQNERSIRACKRTVVGYQAGMDAAKSGKLKQELREAHEAASMKLKEEEARYRDLCRQTRQVPDTKRTSVVAIKGKDGAILSFNQSAAQRARHGAEREYQRTIAGTGANIGGPTTLASRLELRYNNKQESALYDQYLKQVKDGTISPLSTFGNYKEQHQAIENRMIGAYTYNGIQITSQSKHFIERIIGTMDDPSTGKPRSGVSVDDALDAIQNPLKVEGAKVSKNGLISQRFIGANGTVTVNPTTGQLIQCNPTKTSTKESLTKNGETR